MQSVLVTEEMLKPGIWTEKDAGGIWNMHEVHKTFRAEEAPQSDDYRRVLGEFLAYQNDNLEVVVSLRWCSLTRRLYTTKRVWLTVYSYKGASVEYNTAKDGAPLTSFLDSERLFVRTNGHGPVYQSLEKFL